MLTDRWETPPGSEAFYTERLLRLPDGYLCYLPPPYAPPVGPLPALANPGVTFGCFNNLAKLTAPVLAAWAAILAALPEARLVLRTHALGEAATRDRTARRLAAAGLPLDRVALEGGLPHRQLIEAYGGIDIALDPFPYTGGLTVCEALWMGVPVVAMAGDSFCARHALSHLSNLGLARLGRRGPRRLRRPGHRPGPGHPGAGRPAPGAARPGGAIPARRRAPLRPQPGRAPPPGLDGRRAGGVTGPSRVFALR